MKPIFACSLIFVFAFIACGTKEKPENAQSALVTEKNERPSLTLLLPNKNKYNFRDVDEKSVLILFQPDCDHCQHEAEDIERRISGFEGYQLYFVSSYPMEIIEKFAADYKLNLHPNVHFAQASVTEILNNVKPTSAPSIYVYSKGGKLKKSFSGQTDVEQIISAL
jgi:peroxiredoxin